jgi:hypothetical protein
MPARTSGRIVSALEAKLCCAFEAVAHNGTELHRLIDRVLPDLESERAAREIKRAVERKYRNTIPIYVITEIGASKFPA